MSRNEWVSNRNQIVRGQYDAIDFIVVERSEKQRHELAAEIVAELNHAAIMRCALNTIQAGTGEGSIADAAMAAEIARAASCAHEWRTIVISGPAEPKETDVFCVTCGANQYAFYKVIGLEV